MFIKEFLEKYKNDRVKIFVDMDGVIADYVVGSAKEYDKKRPLYSNIKKLEEVSKMPNVELYIFSATRLSEGYNQKQVWLDEYAPFFKKENRIIISREEYDFEKSAVLKANYLRDYPRDGSILILIDDDPRNLKAVEDACSDVVLLKDTALID